MSRVTRVDKDEVCDDTINNTSEIIALKPSNDNENPPSGGSSTLTHDKNRSDLDSTIKEVKQEFRDFYFVKRKDLITRLGNAFGHC